MLLALLTKQNENENGIKAIFQNITIEQIQVEFKDDQWMCSLPCDVMMWFHVCVRSLHCKFKVSKSRPIDVRTFIMH